MSRSLRRIGLALGVSESKLQAAMQSARPTQGSSPQDMAANLAEALGLTEAKVRAALEATRPSGADRPPQAPTTQGQAS